MAQEKKERQISEMSIHERLARMQDEMKAPKSQYNKFGDFHYRSAEDILAAAKPLCVKYQFALTLHALPVVIDGWRYMRTTATLTDWHSPFAIETEGFAREPEHRSKMDDAQVTGSTRSYAAKYALGDLFLLDDTKDPDAFANEQREQKKVAERVQKTISKEKQTKLLNAIEATQEGWEIPATERLKNMLHAVKAESLEAMTEEQWQFCMDRIWKPINHA